MGGKSFNKPVLFQHTFIIKQEKGGFAETILTNHTISIRFVSDALTSHITNERSYLAFQRPTIFNFQCTVATTFIFSRSRAWAIAPVNTMMLLKSGTSRKHDYASHERNNM
ncbi:hypothetical protein BN137_3309 [Cronobacter condimenti 1330]|uniref:Uncharacterized protein n=1 Tax=Cronobacter condimenti 1330 TaxID=1073999 RepID=K8A393_9ENTR|nr:hypothetical protein AFK62_11925 [Cronobacter condimenti 1330]CCJ73920.1 hypothetical protein BN137_3309 [Cronobacter condimenti 1330]